MQFVRRGAFFNKRLIKQALNKKITGTKNGVQTFKDLAIRKNKTQALQVAKKIVRCKKNGKIVCKKKTDARL